MPGYNQFFIFSVLTGYNCNYVTGFHWLFAVQLGYFGSVNKG